MKTVMKKRLCMCVLFFLLLLSFGNTVFAAKQTGWARDGTGWCYYKKGVKQIGWLYLGSDTYYLSKKTGKRYKGLHKISGSIYYFDKTNGSAVRKKWVYAKNNWYYFGADGKALVNKWKTTKKRKYRLGNTGAMLTGMQVIKNKTYYLNTKDTVEKGISYPIGCRRTGSFAVAGQWRYFDENGVMIKSSWKTINNKRCYYQADGSRKVGWLTLNNKTYYFKTSGAMAVNETLTIGSKKWSFDKNGYATQQQGFVYDSAGYIRVLLNNRYYTLEPEFAIDKGVADNKTTDKALLTATVYCEAGNQGLEGMTATAMVILNRTISESQGFPASVRHVIYQKDQFEVVRNGMLGYRLKNTNIVGYAEARQAVTQAYAMLRAYTTNNVKRNRYLPNVLSIAKTDDFNYLFFMTPEAYKATGLTKKSKAFTYRGQTFFLYWK